MTRLILWPIIGHCLIAFAAPCAALAAQSRVVTLRSAIELATHNNLDLISKATLVDQAQATEAVARAASFPKVIGTAILSPINAATGDALRSENDYSKIGVWLQSTITILQPIYAWGKLSSYREAAARGADVARAQLRLDQNQVVYEVKELFYGAILAEELFHFLEDGKRDIDEVVTKVEADQNKKNPTIAKREFYRLKIFAAEAAYRLQEATKLRMLARHALSLKLGFDPEEETIPQDTSLSPVDTTPPAEPELVRVMAAHRPEFEQIVNGIAAKKALLEAERANKYPMLFAGGQITFAHSNVRNQQQSAYAFDPYNRNIAGVGVGVQWNWDFATTLANESKLRSEIDELEKKQAYANSGFRMQLKKVLADLEEAKARLQSSKDALAIGKRWLVSETMGYSLGVGEVKNLIDAYLARAKTVKDNWDAVYRVNMAWAELARTVGTEITPGLAGAVTP